MLGKIICPEVLEVREVLEEINMIWKKYKNKETKVMGPNVFVFKFSTIDEQEDIIKKSPWTVKGYLLAVEIYNPRIPLADIKFLHQHWTVKFRNLQLEHLNVSMVDEIIQDLGGERIEIDPPNAHPRIGRMVKARIRMQLTSPLKRGAWLRTASGGEAWIKYHWEKQPYNICDQCFVVDHSDDNCTSTTT